MTPQSVQNYLSGVKLLHVVTGLDFSFYDTFELRLILRGLDRMHKHLPSRAPLVTPALLRALVQCRGSQLDFVFNCALLFACFLFARTSNLVPVSARSFHPDKHLCRRDIKITRFGLSVSFKWSKTNQKGTKVLTLPLLSFFWPPFVPCSGFLDDVFLFTSSRFSRRLFYALGQFRPLFYYYY